MVILCFTDIRNNDNNIFMLAIFMPVKLCITSTQNSSTFMHP